MAQRKRTNHIIKLRRDKEQGKEGVLLEGSRVLHQKSSCLTTANNLFSLFLLYDVPNEDKPLGDEDVNDGSEALKDDPIRAQTGVQTNNNAFYLLFSYFTNVDN